MPVILIYGDSNVWGANFRGARVRASNRWVNVLKRRLRGKFTLVSNGICGRVAGDFRTDKPHKNGRSDFAVEVEKIQPNLVIIALGTNDFQQRFLRSIDQILTDLLWYEKAAPNSKVVYLLPPKFDAVEAGSEFTKKSLELRDELTELLPNKAVCLHADDVPLSDGLHFSTAGHRQVAKVVGDWILANNV